MRDTKGATEMTQELFEAIIEELAAREIYDYGTEPYWSGLEYDGVFFMIGNWGCILRSLADIDEWEPEMREAIQEARSGQ